MAVISVRQGLWLLVLLVLPWQQYGRMDSSVAVGSGGYSTAAHVMGLMMKAALVVVLFSPRVAGGKRYRCLNKLSLYSMSSKRKKD